MNARDALIQRPDIPDDEVDDIVAIAARMQDEGDAGPTASMQEIEAVAAELDIDPMYVEQAVERWRTNKVEREQARIARERNRSLLTFGALAVILAGIVVCVFGALIGASSIREAHHEMNLAQQQLEVVLERQAALAPQLAALGGGDPGALNAVAQQIEDADDIEARLDAAEALSVALAQQIANSSNPSSDDRTQVVLNLSHEVTGSQNRITTETRRYREAKANYDRSASGPLGTLAVSLGLAP